jgi:hypothetical protein
MQSTGARAKQFPEKDTPMRKRAKRGRPTRAAASAKALESIDLATINAREVLLTIAADSSAPATARVQACRALLQGDPAKQPDKDDDPVTTLALKLLRGKP